jgi:methyl-accepting chemotaxis protein
VEGGVMGERFGIGAKLGAGFGAIIALALGGGLLTGWRIAPVATLATALAQENVPEIALANAMERGALEVMLAVRSYVASEDPAQLEVLRPNLAAVRTAAQEATSLASKNPKLAAMGHASARVAKSAEQLEALVADTARLTGDMQRQRAAADAAARRYQQVARTFQTVQKDALQGEIIAGLEGDQLLKRLERIALSGEILDLGDAIVSDTWKAQLKQDPDLLRDTVKAFDEVNRRLDALKAITSFAGDLSRIEECRRAGADSRQALESFLAAWVQQRQLAQQRLGKVGAEIVEQARGTATLGLADVKRGAVEAAEAVTLLSRVILLGLLVAAIAATASALLVTRQITRPLEAIIQALRTSAEHVSGASSQVAMTSHHLAAEAGTQAANVEEVSSSLAELSQATRQNADHARAANGTVVKASEAARRGSAGVERLGGAIGKIRASAKETAQIVRTIDEIAFQTNLLALNAAVEAARAGDAGKGFAVVAAEVGVLAQRSADAARTTAGLIEESQRNAEGGSAVTVEVEAVLREIAASVDELTALVGRVSDASHQQASGIQQITTSVGELDRFNQSTAGSAEESASASEELTTQAGDLQDLVDRLTRMVNGAGIEPGVPKAAQATRRLAASPTA